MSFLNTFRFGRSSRKNKQAAEQAANDYHNNHHHNHNYSSNNTSKTSLSSASASGVSASSSNNNTQKPLFLCQPFVRTALVKGSFQTIVMLPKYVDLGEWLALNTFEFFTYLNQFYGVLSEFVTPQTCPTMNAGPGIDYLWIENSNNKKAVKLPANQYIDNVLAWISNKFDDQSLFPTQAGVPFPPNFTQILRSIWRQMFRIFAHIYHNHFDKIVHLSLEAHWNSLFAHFISFGKTFELVDSNDLTPLVPLIEALESQGKIVVSPANSQQQQ